MFDAKQVGLIPFIMAGDPSLETSFQLALMLIDEGAAALELGVPFSDALADGPVIQAAAERALRHNVTLEAILQLAGRIHKARPDAPLIIFTYLNPLLQFGVEAYVKAAKSVGISATLTVDLPPEEAEEYIRWHRAVDLKTVFLSSPTTSNERLRLIDQASSGFIYVVSRAGVTGVQAQMAAALADDIRRVRQVSHKPLAVGFGIATGAQAAQVAELADAVVVGSAFVKLIADFGQNPALLETRVRELARELIQGIRGKNARPPTPSLLG